MVKNSWAAWRIVLPSNSANSTMHTSGSFNSRTPASKSASSMLLLTPQRVNVLLSLLQQDRCSKCSCRKQRIKCVEQHSSLSKYLKRLRTPRPKRTPRNMINRCVIDLFINVEQRTLGCTVRRWMTVTNRTDARAIKTYSWSIQSMTVMSKRWATSCTPLEIRSLTTIRKSLITSPNELSDFKCI